MYKENQVHKKQGITEKMSWTRGYQEDMIKCNVILWIGFWKNNKKISGKIGETQMKIIIQ